MNFLPGRYGDGAVEIAGLGRGPIAEDQLVDGATPGGVTVGLRPETLAIVFDGSRRPDRRGRGRGPRLLRRHDDLRRAARRRRRPVTISMENLEGRPVLEPGDRPASSGIRARWCCSPEG